MVNRLQTSKNIGKLPTDSCGADESEAYEFGELPPGTGQLTLGLKELGKRGAKLTGVGETDAGPGGGGGSSMKRPGKVGS